MAAPRTLIRNAQVITALSSERGDVLIQGERIVAAGAGLSAPGATIVDAAGLLLLPGLIDVHIHVREPGAVGKEDWTSATRAALAGGVTTIFDMPNNATPTVTAERVAGKLDIAARGAVCDYGVYLGATSKNVGLAARLGGEIAGLKIYLGSTTGSLLTDDWRLLYDHLRSTPEVIPVAVHAEDEQCLHAFQDTSASDHNRNRPPICAELAVHHVITAARAAGRGAHIAHVSTAREVSLIQQARQEGIPMTCEVCPHHLFLTSEDALLLGGWGKVNPPLREPGEVQALWEQLARVDIVATDHAPHRPEEKGHAYEQAPSGFPGLETLLPLMFLAVREGRLSLQHFVQLTSTGPANLFHTHRKGRIAPGYDADLVLVDLAATRVIRAGALQTKPNDTPFRGWHLPGRIIAVWRRGERVLTDGILTVEPGTGKPVALATI
ncbi:MAG: dihydroorotase family protein [Chloroflexi bacterium]|nr:dihydroorotase family protein [Chloroflexota bacterium]